MSAGSQEEAVRSLRSSLARGRSRALVIALSLGLLSPFSCSSPVGPGTGLELSPTPLPTPLALPVALDLEPSVAGVGQRIDARISGISTAFSDATTIHLGDDVRVLEQTPLSQTELSLTLEIAPDASPGYRTLELSGAGEGPDALLRLEQALLVQVGSIAVEPRAGGRGSTLAVTVTMQGVPDVREGFTWISFGEGITTESFTLQDPGTGIARLYIASDAPSGARTVELQNGPSRVLLPEGFTVDRSLLAITFDPPVIAQGSLADFVIEGVGTHFEQDRTSVELGLGVLIDPNDPAALVVESPTRIVGKLTACEAAVGGVHEVVVSTPREAGLEEQVRALEGFTVTEVPLAADRARASVALSLSYTARDGLVTPSVTAGATFFASTGACGSSDGTYCPSDPAQLDVPQFNPPLGCTPTSSTTQYPPTPTFDAGDFVFLEASGVSIALAKELDVDGSITYRSKSTIPLSSYHFATGYTLRATGGTGDMSIPAFEVPNALYTLTSDFELVSPDLRDTPTLDRFDSIIVQWQDPNGQPGAQTFPTALMSSTLRTADPETYESRAIDFPILTDDGYEVYPADMISQLPVGPGYFQLRAIRAGTPFYLPGSLYSSNAGSAIYYTGYFELRD